MKIKDFLIKKFLGANEGLLPRPNIGVFDLGISRLDFGRVIFLNIVEILTDLINDVTFTPNGKNDALLLAQFKVFVEHYGQNVLNALYLNGFSVIGQDNYGFRPLRADEWSKYTAIDGNDIIQAHNQNIKVYVLYSETYSTVGVSDATFLSPFIKYLDNVLNGSNTISERLGSLVVCSPKNGATAPTAAVLTKEQKDTLEKELMKEYGCLENQRNIMVLPREMNFDIVNLAGLDQHTAEKARLAILAICDRVKVPANQVAIIDASSSKSLSNGSELREGDFNKYQSFERLLNRSFVRLASEIGLYVDYEIYNKPQRQQTPII